MVYVLCLAIGVLTGLRSMTTPAMTSWGANSGRIAVAGTPLAFLGTSITMWIFVFSAVSELVADKLPKTPSRKRPLGVGARIVAGALCGGALAAAHGALVVGAALGVAGAVVGTLAGAGARAALARKLGKDFPAALIEDVVALVGSAAVVLAA